MVPWTMRSGIPISNVAINWRRGDSRFRLCRETLTLLPSEGWSAFIFSKGFRWYLPVCIFLIVAGYLTYRGLSGTHSDQHDKTSPLTPRWRCLFPDCLGAFGWRTPERSVQPSYGCSAYFHWRVVFSTYSVSVYCHLRGKTPWHNAALKAAWILIPTAHILLVCGRGASSHSGGF